MFTRAKSFSFVAAITVSALFIADNAQAQCSGGGRGGGGPSQSSFATGSFNPLVSLASSANSYAAQRQLALQQQQMLAMRQQMMAQQQQLYAMRQQQTQQLTQSRYDQQQAIQTSRLARAEAKRAKRADRIVALKAKRNADQMDEESDVMLAGTTSASTLVSVSEPNPFR